MADRKKTLKPPRLAVRLLKRFFPDETGLFTQLGDIDEAFRAAAQERSRFAAKTWYWMAVLRSIPYPIRQSLTCKPRWKLSLPLRLRRAVNTIVAGQQDFITGIINSFLSIFGQPPHVQKNFTFYLN